MKAMLLSRTAAAEERCWRSPICRSGAAARPSAGSRRGVRRVPGRPAHRRGRGARGAAAGARHQAAGRIVPLGVGVDAFAIGDAVGVGWLFSTCRDVRVLRERAREPLPRGALHRAATRTAASAERMSRRTLRLSPAAVIHRRSMRRRCCAPASSAIDRCGCRRSSGRAAGLIGFGAWRTWRSRSRGIWRCECTRPPRGASSARWRWSWGPCGRARRGRTRAWRSTRR